MSQPIRRADPADLGPLAKLWHDGWHEAHAAHVPAELVRHRTPETFAARLARYGDRLRTAGPSGAPLGFCVVTGDEIDQLFVSDKARGTGLAQTLIEDGEARLAAAGIRDAHLLCIPENTRAMRFYERMGWTNHGVSIQTVEIEAGGFPLSVAVFRKTLE
ncbi:GNAT family N-acetyltransferase [Alphaproteobacteria bacterium GH1-50]|uniref:GNAT family N-acetyltransferase n=1 Tax=Kangsaoukella pontilimi TaxID=2691042 RepID=A0A7C9N1I7_9RHOB|nr:GNAT family N-acetyltransferase [Kangsaoukella pontilimi]MXQ08758.1 GNAT family N-acetyltransferase [Kangsaoukella pontilimi]